MRNLKPRDLGRPFISLDDLRKVLQDFLFAVTDTDHGNFFAFRRFLWRGQRVTFVELLFIERYKWQTCYRTFIKYVLEKSAFSTLLIFYFISCEVGRRTQPSSIHLKVARYSFPGQIPPKFEHKLCHHKQSFEKIATTVVLDKEDQGWSGLIRVAMTSELS